MGIRESVGMRVTDSCKAVACTLGRPHGDPSLGPQSNFLQTGQGSSYYLHFAEAETEAQRSQAMCSGSALVKNLGCKKS